MSANTNLNIQRRRRWPLVLGGIAGALVVVYFVATSGVFIRSVILPRVSAAVGSEVSAEDVSLSPFSSLVLRGVKLVPKGQTALAEIREVRARYSLLSIIGGDIRVDEVTVDGPTINVVEKADGSGNLDSLLKGLPQSPEEPKTTSPVPKLSIRNVQIKGGVLKYDRTDAAGGRTVAEISGLNVGVDQVINGQATKLTIGADAKAELTGQPQSGRLAGKLGGTIDATLDANLLPTLAKGGVRVDLGETTGALQTLGGVGVALDVDLTKDELKDFAVRFSQRGQELGRIGLKGTLDLPKSEARLNYEIQGLDRRVLALAGAASGLDLGDTRVGASGKINVLKGGVEVTSAGKLQVNSFSLAGNGGRTPVVDLSTDYSFALNQADKKVQIDRLDFLGTQGGREFLKGGLDRSMGLSWEKAAQGFREASFSLKVGTLDLSQWRAVLPTNPPTALVSTELKITAEQAGRLIRFSLTATAQDLTAAVGVGGLRNATATVSVAGSFTDFAKVAVENYSIDVRQGREQLLGLTGLADWNLTTQQGGIQNSLEAKVPALLAIYPVPDIQFSQGVLKSSISATYRDTGSSADISVTAANLTGRVADIELKDYQVTFGVAAGLKGQSIDLQRMSLAAQTGFATGGSVMARGKFELPSSSEAAAGPLKSGTLEFNVVALNESALAPFLAKALAPNRLTSVQLDVQGNAVLEGATSQSVKTKVRVSNLRVQDPAGKLPKTPLELGLELDSSLRGTLIDVRKLIVDLGATPQATNRLEVVAQFDSGTNKPVPTVVTITSPGLDLTPLYDLFSGTTNAAAAAPANPPKDSAPGAPNIEPPPIHLPLKDATLKLDIARIFLRKVDIAALKGEARLKDDVVTLDGFGFTMNGAPVMAKARANLSVPGYEYDVDFSAQRLQMAPLADTFVPVLNGAAQGEFLSALKVKGAGVTGASLKRNLNGFVTLEATNAQVRIPSTPIPVPAWIRSFVWILPAEIDAAHVLGLIGKSSVLAEPIRTIQAHAIMGQGGVVLTNTRIASAAFESAVTGGLQFNDVLSNSPVQMPVLVAFATDGKLPELRSIGRLDGTIGKLPFKPDYVGLAAVAKGFNIPGVGNVGERVSQAGALLNEKTGGALDKGANAVKSLLPGDGKSTNGVINALGGALGALTGGRQTNNAATNGPAATNAPAKAPSLLDGLPFGRGKK
jgi:uncharacterized protein involved in outer membrane biogenesis